MTEVDAEGIDHSDSPAAAKRPRSYDTPQDPTFCVPPVDSVYGPMRGGTPVPAAEGRNCVRKETSDTAAGARNVVEVENRRSTREASARAGTIAPRGPGIESQLVERVLRSHGSTAIRRVLANPERYRVQVLLTEIVNGVSQPTGTRRSGNRNDSSSEVVAPEAGLRHQDIGWMQSTFIQPAQSNFARL